MLAAPQRGNHFAETSTRARQSIAELGARFVRNGMRVLAHGHSRVVLALLRLAVKQGVQFDVVVTEGRVSASVRSELIFSSSEPYTLLRTAALAVTHDPRATCKP